MNILVLGAGSVGGYFGGRLAQHGADVTFLVRERRQAELATKGLCIRSCFGDVDIPVKTVVQDRLAAEYDTVMFACKAFDLDAAMDSIAPALTDGTTILPLLNGIAHLNILNRRFGDKRVLGGTAKIAATVAADGTIQHLNDWNFLKFGEQDGGPSKRTEKLARAFPTATVQATAVDSILQEMWDKLVHLSTAAAMTCLMRGSVGEIARVPEAERMFQLLLDQAAKVSEHNGYRPSEAFMETYRTLFADQPSGYTTSMLRDAEAGKRTEAQHIVGHMVREARRSGMDSSLFEVALANLEVYEQRRLAGRF